MLNTAIPQSVIDRAHTIVKQGNERNAFDWFNKQLSMSDRSWMDGFVGEMTTKYMMGMDITTTGLGPDGGVDLIMNNMKVDVKTQLFKKSTPDYSWFFNFAAPQLSDRYDALMFNFINEDRTTLYLAGWITKMEFDISCEFFPKGVQNPYNKYHTFSCDTFTIRADQLTKHNPLDWNQYYTGWNQINE